jgi:hypothetical protein
MDSEKKQHTSSHKKINDNTSSKFRMPIPGLQKKFSYLYSHTLLETPPIIAAIM